MTKERKNFFESLAGQSSFLRYLRTLTWIAGIYLVSLHGIQFAIGNDFVGDEYAMIVLRFSQFIGATVLGMLIITLTVRLIDEYMTYTADQKYRCSGRD